MQLYTLYNRRLKKHLTHPSRGVWYTPDIEEARQMMSLVTEYSDAVGMPKDQQEYTIIEANTGQEVPL